MKFLVNNFTKCVPRLGVISEIQRLPNVRLETPLVLLYTKGGSVPHLGRDVLKLVTKQTHCVQVPIVSSIFFQESLTNTNQTLSEFIGFKDDLVYVTVQDSAEIVPTGHHLQNNIPIWTRSGKTYLNPNNYMSAIETFKPDIYCLLADSDTNKTSSKKRISKSVDRTFTFVRDCLDIHRNSKHLQYSMVVAPVVGGYSIPARNKCIEDLLDIKHDYGAYLIDGLRSNSSPELESIQFEEDVKPIVEYVIESLPDDKIRIMEGCWNPLNVINLVRLGVDVFDTTYLNVVTERSSALIFQFRLGQHKPNNKQMEINLKDNKYREDFTPILDDCKCLTCSKYTKAYIHHLLNVQELLAPVLLSIHNTHHYLEFFQILRRCIKDKTLDDLRCLIESQCENRLNEKVQ